MRSFPLGLLSSLAVPALALGHGCSAGQQPAASSASALGAGGGTADHSAASEEATTGAGPGGGMITGTGGAGGSMPPAPKFTPSGYLLITAERLAELKSAVKNGDPAIAGLKALVDADLGGSPDLWHDSPENRALVYLLTQDASYAQAAFAWEEALIQSADVRFDSYLDFGDLMKHAALVLNWCGDALSADQKSALANYLDSWTHELWFNNQGDGWGLNDPGNNYHHAFLQGTAFAGYALKQIGQEDGQKFIDLVMQDLQKQGGVLDYLASNLVGGDWREGANYGERSKQRLFDALAVIASMGGPNELGAQPFFPAALTFAVYQLQPDHLALAPAGDLARDSAMPVTASERDYLETAAYFLPDSLPRRLANWYIANVTPPYGNPDAGLAFKEVVFGATGPAEAPDSLPLGYRAAGTGFINLRSGWDAGATSLTISAAPMIEQSHQHLDVGSFVLFKRGWLGMDASTLSMSGLDWAPGAHNAIHVAGEERLTGSVGGLVRFQDDGAIAYAGIDATSQYRVQVGPSDLPLMSEVTREIIYERPSTVIVYDRVAPLDPGRAYEWRLHVPAAPSGGSGSFAVQGQGAGLTLVPLLSGAVAVTGDGDLDGGPSSAWRIAEAPTGSTSRFLNAIAVGDGAPPPVTAARVATTGAMEGADTGDLVALFSKNGSGAPAALPISYTVGGVQKRTHVIANVASALDVTVDKSGPNTTVTLAAGAKQPPSKAGVVVFTN